jgi:tRNA(Ile)-lysidine synthase
MARTAKNRKTAFEQRVLRTLKGLEKRPSSILVGCSGGADSMVLLEVLWRLRNSAGWKLQVAHVHHGPGREAPDRQRAWNLVSTFCRGKEIPFLSNSTDGHPAFSRQLKSEAALRELRWQHLFRWQQETGCDVIAVAHHYQDLLETRLMRLVRGTGAQGFRSMQVFSEPVVRPLLRLEKTEILDYAEAVTLKFIDDPSNQNTQPFRNWMRQWLAVLEKRHPGGTRNLARSLGDLAEQLELMEKSSITEVMTEGGIDRRAYLASAPGRKKASLARYCFKLGLKNYTQGHIEELHKRLDDRQKHFTFELLQCVWRVSTERIEASRV